MGSRRSLIKNALASVVVLAVDGCGSSKKAGDVQTGRSIRFQASWTNDAEFLGYFVALDPEFSYYKKMGLDVEYLTGGPDIIPESSLINGQADIALTTPETTAQYIARDKIPLVIVGSQYQRNPVGVVSLMPNAIRAPHDLVGKRLAVAPANVLSVKALLKINGVPESDVVIVPYAYDPQILLSGTADATIDFVTNVPFAIRKLGREPYSFLLNDFGFPLFNDLVVVKQKTLDERFDDVVAFLAGCMLGWEQNYTDPTFARFPQRFKADRFKESARTVENETDFNRAQKDLMTHPEGYFSMDAESIQRNVSSLQKIGLELPPAIFDTRALSKARTLRKSISEPG